MPDILKLLIKYKTPCTISTKSNLLIRDFDLFEQLATISYVNIAVSVITVDEKVKHILEPLSPSIEDRLDRRRPVCI